MLMIIIIVVSLSECAYCQSFSVVIIAHGKKPELLCQTSNRIRMFVTVLLSFYQCQYFRHCQFVCDDYLLDDFYGIEHRWEVGAVLVSVGDQVLLPVTDGVHTRSLLPGCHGLDDCRGRDR